MPHPTSLRAVAAYAVTLLLTALVAVVPLVWSTPAGAAQAEEQEPLRVHLDAISATVPRRGAVRIAGTVTNTSASEFTRINLHAFRSESPISDPAALSASAAIAPEEYVGPRITTPGTFPTVEVLAPGASARFSMAVPVDLLGLTEPGVYWIGVHAFGDGELPRDDFADGRARTFIPVMPPGRQRLEAAIVLPLRQVVWYDDDGSLAATDQWQRLLGDGGRLEHLLDIAEQQPATAFTWLVDPAVLDAVSRLAAGNPARSLDPDPTVPGQEPATPSPAPGDESPSPTAEPDEGSPVGDGMLAKAAADWLKRFVATTAGRDVLALPYGDLDVSAAARHDPDRLVQARSRSDAVLAEHGITARAAFAPEDDAVSAEALLASPTDTIVLVGDQAFAAPPSAPDSVVRIADRNVVVASAGAQMGGPAPTPPHDPLAIRQRLVSEAALRALADSRTPIVLTLPSRWQPEEADALFSAFDEPWLSSVSVADLAARPALPLPDSSLAYPALHQRAELPATSFAAATRLDQAASLMEDVLTLETTVESQVRDEALVTLSQQHRGRAAAAVGAAHAARRSLTDQLASIDVETPPAVILSSDSGPLGASVINGLDQPVSVVVEVVGDEDIEVSGSGVRELAARARASVRFEAVARRAPRAAPMSDAGILRSSAVMAAGTIVSRLSGFVR
ncbi:MAG: hypothetical protein LT071_14965, partial [Nocardioides sp.]|nr:hypothetical protein [Nocardioides sp.]